MRTRRTNAARAQHFRCFYCRVLMCMTTATRFARLHAIPERLAEQLRCTAEHLEPRCHGGSNRAENIAAACLFCNKIRGSRVSVDGFRARVRSRIARRKWHAPEVWAAGLIADETFPPQTAPPDFAE